MWLYENQEFNDEMIGENVGFVYIITNLTNQRMYVGKKLFTKSKTYQKNNKKKRKRVESDWKTYTGSNEELNEDIKNGHEIKKEIIHLCSSKGWLSYMESKEIFVRDCVINNSYYNSWIQCKIRRTHLK